MAEARRLFQAILNAKPNHAKAKKGLARLSASSAAASKEAPQNVVREIGDLLQSGDAAAALKNAKSALKVYPNSAQLWNILGVACHHTGDRPGAINALQRVVRLNPNAAEVHLNLGNALRAERRYAEAAESLKRAIQLQPGYAYPHNTLGNIFSDIADYKQATLAFENAIRLDPNYVEAMMNLSSTLSQCNDFQRSIEVAQKVVVLQPEEAASHICLGRALNASGDHEGAVSWLKKALERDPNNEGAKFALGIALGDSRDRKGAEAAFREIVEFEASAGAYRQISELKRFSEIDDDVAAMERLLVQLKKGRNTEGLAEINFALAKVYRDLGDYRKSYKFITQGNRYLLERIGYDLSDDIEYFRKLEATSKDFFQLDVDHRPKTLPIFIVGMPRSGTTLVEQILSSHSKVSAGGELGSVNTLGEKIAIGNEAITSESLQEFRSKYLTDLDRVSDGAPFATDKMPHNFRYLPLLHAAFPDAKIILMRRDARAVCWSNFWQHFYRRRLGYSFSLNTTVDYYHMFERLMTNWHKLLAGHIYDFDYDRLTEEQEVQTRALLSHLQLPWEDAVMSPHKNKHATKTASRLQVVKPVYKASSAEWQKFEPFLAGAFDSLAQYQSS